VSAQEPSFAAGNAAIELRYDCDGERLGPALAACFRPLVRDAATNAWLTAHSEPHGWWRTKLTEWASSFVSSYDAHGLLGAYPMHLLSEQAWRELLEGVHHRSLLDVGAGAGYVTEHAGPHFDDIVCTETAHQLAKRLAARGLVVHELDLTQHSLARTFDVVSAFNVLDRTPEPLCLLRSLVAHTRPGGCVLISLPLPISAHVHVRGGTSAPTERLPSLAPDFETAARELSERLLQPAGLTVTRLSRLPYLSRGDVYRPRYVLDSALWVCTTRPAAD
jgi:SAM-dependent methyltransferase